MKMNEEGINYTDLVVAYKNNVLNLFLSKKMKIIFFKEKLLWDQKLWKQFLKCEEINNDRNQL